MLALILYSHNPEHVTLKVILNTVQTSETWHFRVGLQYLNTDGRVKIINADSLGHCRNFCSRGTEAKIFYNELNSGRT